MRGPGVSVVLTGNSGPQTSGTKAQSSRIACQEGPRPNQSSRNGGKVGINPVRKMLTGPEKYDLTLTPTAYSLEKKFSGSCTKKVPKLYVVLAEGQVLYVGVTRQSMRSRFRYGFKADGRNGYHGYAWRHKHAKANLYVWAAAADLSLLDVETIEAEVVFLFRQSTGSWPACQTEIHFHQSTEAHRNAAADVLKAIAVA